MTGKLILFELNKKWRSSRFLLLGYLGVQALNLLVTRLFFWNSRISEALTSNNGLTSTDGTGLPFILTTILFFLLACAIGAFPIIEGIYRFERDLSGKQAYLELAIPAASWKKLAAKLIATMCSMIVCGTASLLSMVLYFAVNGKLDKSVFEILRQCLDALSKQWVDVSMTLLYILFAFASLFMLVFFCISLAKSFSHKNKVAVPIGIIAFLVISGLISALGIQLDKVPIIEYRLFDVETNLSRTLSDIVLFVAGIAATGWLMEKRIEH